MDITQLLTIIESEMKLKKASNQIMKTEPSVFERIDWNEFSRNIDDIVFQIRDDNEQGVDSFLLSSFDKGKIETLFKSKRIDAKKQKILVERTISDTKNLANAKAEIIESPSMSASGICLDLSIFNDSEGFSNLLNWVKEIKYEMEKINPEAMLVINDPLNPKFQDGIKDFRDKYGIKKMIWRSVGEKIAEVEPNCWIETRNRTIEFDSQRNEFVEKNNEIEFRNEEELNKEFANLMESNADSVGFEAGLTSGYKGEDVPKKGQRKFDISAYFARIVSERAKRMEQAKTPEGRYTMERLTALNLKQADVPQIQYEIWTELLTLLRIHKDLMNSQDNTKAVMSFEEQTLKLYSLLNERNEKAWTVSKVYIKRRLNIINTASASIENKIKYSSEIAGFARGLVEMNLRNKHISEQMPFEDKIQEEALGWALAEAELMLKAQSFFFESEAKDAIGSYYSSIMDSRLQILGMTNPQGVIPVQTGIHNSLELEKNVEDALKHAQDIENIMKQVKSNEEKEEIINEITNTLWGYVKRNQFNSSPLAVAELLKILALYGDKNWKVSPDEIGKRILRIMPALVKEIRGAA